jgi:hypothetical protein
VALTVISGDRTLAVSADGGLWCLPVFGPYSSAEWLMRPPRYPHYLGNLAPGLAGQMVGEK